LPRTDLGKRISTQLIDAATSVASNYRAACRAKSRADFISKIATVTEEADECCGWLEMISSSKLRPEGEVAPLLDEAEQLTKIFAASLATAKRRDSGRKAATNQKSPNQSQKSPNNPQSLNPKTPNQS
jgi:four helix bundle protein